MDPKQQAAILAQVGREGWTVVSAVPSPEAQPTVDRLGNSVPGKYPEGSEVWNITDGKGHNQTMVVKPPAAYPGPYSSTTNDPGAYNPNPSVVEPPKDLPAASGTANQGFTDILSVKNPDGTSTRYGKDPKDGQFKPLPGVPTEPATGSTTAKPTPANQLEQIKDPNTGTIVKLRDPATGTVIDLPNASTATPSKPVIVNGANGAIYSWDGSTLTLQQGGTAQPKEGDTRRNVQGGMAVTEKFQGGQWVTDPSVPPVPFDATKPKEGDTRPNVASGQTIQEVYRGGSWVVDPSVPPKPYGPQIPTTVPTNALDATIVQRNPVTGAIETVPNPNYQPTDPAQKTVQLQKLAQSKRDDLQKQVLNGAIQPDEAQQQFQDFWDTTIEPQRQQLQQLQDQTTFNNQIAAGTAQNQRDQNTTTAASDQLSAANTGASTGSNLLQSRMQQAAGLFNNTLGIAQGKNYGVTAHGANAPDISGLPDAIGSWLTAMGGGQSTFDTAANLVKNIDPNNQSGFASHAAAALHQVLDRASQVAGGAYQPGGPAVPQGPDYAAALNQSKYGGAFAPPPAAPPTTAPTTTIDPDGTIHVAHSMGSAFGSALQIGAPG